MEGIVFNHIKDKSDERDLKFKSVLPPTYKFPPSIDLRKSGHMPPVFNQGSLGSCGANSISNALQFYLKKDFNVPDFVPSRLYIYYFSRVLDGSPVDQDTGISLRNGIKSIQKYGVCKEETLPYVISKFAVKPSDNIIKSAQQFKNYKYYSVPQDLTSIKLCLNQGLPIVLGIQIYSGFMTQQVSKTGIANIPSTTEKYLGGHAVLLVGYNDVTQRFILCNSWGTRWGMNGFFTLPYKYITDSKLASDFWCIQLFF